jgi:RNA polymerase sigma-70 factor (ECF subfamily)
LPTNKKKHLNSFDQLYSENYQKVFRVALKISGNADNASDIVQEVFLSLFDKLQNGSEINYPGTWLYKVTVNKCCDGLRKQKRFVALEVAANNEFNDEAVETQETRHIIEKALCELHPRERAIMVLYSEGLSYKEISEASGVKFQSVGKTISRILEKLEKKLKGLHDDLY